MSFKIGDVVRLKSGSPRMSVSEINSGNSYVKVEWYEDGKINAYAFHADQLKLDEDK
ncbi:YodC family protein [Flavobacterium sp. AG291]|uniref:YodC family protein n=1 Tax=Flavobacterium sp. AG291 TaxID=2184000 RepID=UPI000E0B35E5|nr:DUF2158 domain-containing protein [Flavobacterium sp. AG291]RDI14581.1 uncharacterized protein YodC (DUF2158 family) [Flavobacterium sp. AG291]